MPYVGDDDWIREYLNEWLVDIIGQGFIDSGVKACKKCGAFPKEEPRPIGFTLPPPTRKKRGKAKPRPKPKRKRRTPSRG